MGLSFRISILLGWLSIILLCAVLLFAKGFLLKRIMISNSSSCEQETWALKRVWSEVNGWVRGDSESIYGGILRGCSRTLKPRFQKAVIIIIDGLRYDFLDFDPDLDSSLALPFQNKMKKLSKILQNTQNSRLYKFEADPPTTTMQRIKGLTTGGLPTFIDAGANWDSYQITEDNVLDQLLRQGKNISFMGCSTWTELFPVHFHRKIPYSALNVKDLDTIDYGIMKHLVPEIRRTDWSLIIAHFLGVDHCGHRYGTHHHEMTRKLTEMDGVISDVVAAIDDDTVLFVMGDHGMTRSGDHGGDSPDEVMAGLFAYSKKNIFPLLKERPKSLPHISQIDLVPTLALLLDFPVPFSNLGSIITDVFDGESGLTDGLPSFGLPDGLIRTVNMAYSSYLNCKQVVTYISEYELVSADLPAQDLDIIRKSFEYLDEKFTDLLQYIASIEWSDDAQPKGVSVDEILQDIEGTRDAFLLLLARTKLVCRSVWAKFDLMSMALGLSVLGFMSILVVCCPSLSQAVAFNGHKQSVWLYVAGIGFGIIGFVYLGLPFQDVELVSIVVFGVISFSFSLWLLSCGFSTTSPLTVLPVKFGFANVSGEVVFLCFCLAGYLASIFANSYIVYEDASTLFMIQSMLLVRLLSHSYGNLRSPDAAAPGAGKRGHFMSVRSRVLKSLSDDDSLWLYGRVLLGMLCLRVTKYFWFCRETQLKCSLSPYALPLASLLSEFTEGHALERLLVALVAILGVWMSGYYYLKKKGALNGFTPIMFVVRYLSLVVVILIFADWALQLVLQHKLAIDFNLMALQQVYLPRVVYVVCISCIAVLVYNPLGIFVVFRDKWTRSSMKMDSSDSHLTQKIFRTIRDNFAEESDDYVPPLVYGLGSCYSSSYAALLLVLTLLSALTLMDGMALPVFLAWISGWCVSGALGLRRPYVDKVGVGEMFTSVLTWHFLASYVFFGSGHQTTIPAIRFQAAYVGFTGSVSEMIPQALVVLTNTFWSHILGAFSLPLLLVWRKPVSGTDREVEPVARGLEDRESEVSMEEKGDASLSRLFTMILLYAGISALKVFVASGAASLHRRHLMLWKIFAPRFLFEACTLTVVLPSLIAGFLFFSRVQACLKLWMADIAEHEKLASAKY